MRAFLASWMILLVALGSYPAETNTKTASARIAQLVTQLGADDFTDREAATDGLVEIGEPALEALRDAQHSTDPEVRTRARDAIEAILQKAKLSATTGLELVLVKRGQFQMGSPGNESGHRPEEVIHRVTVTRSFLMGKYEVTQTQYESVMKVNPSGFWNFGEGETKKPRTDKRRFPVETVTWFDAIEFCNRLSKRDGYSPFYELTDSKKQGKCIVAAKVKVVGGNGYRLPTEAEWEYACRAGTLTPYHFSGRNTGKQSNVKATRYTGGYGTSGARWKDHKRTTHVGSYPPNGFGLYDMHGNVAEWCFDWYDKDYYKASPKANPRGPKTGRHRVNRGGSWIVTETSSRSAARFYQAPEDRKNYVGFRVVRTP